MAGLIALSCAQIDPLVSWVPGYEPRQDFTQEDLRAELAEFSSRHHLQVAAAADGIAEVVSIPLAPFRALEGMG